MVQVLRVSQLFSILHLTNPTQQRTWFPLLLLFQKPNNVNPSLHVLHWTVSRLYWRHLKTIGRYDHDSGRHKFTNFTQQIRPHNSLKPLRTINSGRNANLIFQFFTFHHPIPLSALGQLFRVSFRFQQMIYQPSCRRICIPNTIVSAPDNTASWNGSVRLNCVFLSDAINSGLLGSRHRNHESYCADNWFWPAH
jgi:hypothetical protein